MSMIAFLSWLFPWPFIILVAVAVAVALIAYETLVPKGEHAVPRRVLAPDEPENAPKAIDAAPQGKRMEPPRDAQVYGDPLPHSPDWPMDATSPGTAIIDYDGPPLSDAEAAEIEERFLGDLANWKPGGFLNARPVPEIAATPVTDGWIPEEHDRGCTCGPCAERRRPVVTVTDDPAGRHARPRAYLVHAEPPPYCSTCGSDEHWTDGHSGPDPLVTQMVADRAASRAQQAIDDDLRAAGLKVYDSEDDALKSMWTRAMGLAIADVEAARR